MSNYTSKKDLDVASQLGLKRNTMEGATFQYTKGVGLTSTPPIGIEGVLTPQRQIFLYFPPNTFLRVGQRHQRVFAQGILGPIVFAPRSDRFAYHRRRKHVQRQLRAQHGQPPIGRFVFHVHRSE